MSHKATPKVILFFFPHQPAEAIQGYIIAAAAPFALRTIRAAAKPNDMAPGKWEFLILIYCMSHYHFESLISFNAHAGWLAAGDDFCWLRRRRRR